MQREERIQNTKAAPKAHKAVIPKPAKRWGPGNSLPARKYVSSPPNINSNQRDFTTKTRSTPINVEDTPAASKMEPWFQCFSRGLLARMAFLSSLRLENFVSKSIAASSSALSWRRIALLALAWGSSAEARSRNWAEILFIVSIRGYFAGPVEIVGSWAESSL